MDERRRELEEQQDEIHLALLMDEYAEAMGAQARKEAEAAFEAGELTIPQEAEAACRSILEKATGDEHCSRTAKAPIKYLLVAAATAVLLLGTLVIAQAAGTNVLGKMASWTDSVFRYSSEPKDTQPEEIGPYTEIEEALHDLGLPVKLAPRRLPDGYSVTGITQEEADEMKIVGITAEKDGRTIRFSVEEHLSTDIIEYAQWEKTDQPVKLYTSNGRTFYVFENELGWTGTWTDGRYIVSLFGFESMDDIELTIDSLRGK